MPPGQTFGWTNSRENLWESPCGFFLWEEPVVISGSGATALMSGGDLYFLVDDECEGNPVGEDVKTLREARDFVEDWGPEIINERRNPEFYFTEEALETLDSAVQEHSAFRDFHDLVASAPDYTPTIEIWNPSSRYLADCFDHYMKAIQDPRRAHRRKVRRSYLKITTHEWCEIVPGRTIRLMGHVHLPFEGKVKYDVTYHLGDTVVVVTRHGVERGELIWIEDDGVSVLITRNTRNGDEEEDWTLPLSEFNSKHNKKVGRHAG